MPRIRTIKPEFWTDSKTVGLSPLARLLFIGAWNFADDYGALEPDAMQLKLRVLPAEQCDPQQLVQELLDAGLLRVMTNGEETFWIVAGWEKHQKVDKRSTSQYGDPDSWSPAEPSPNPPEPRRAPPSPRPGREGIKEGIKEGKGEDRADADAPTPLPPPDDSFEHFWDTYPRKDGMKGGGAPKKKARQTWKRLTAEQRDQALAGVGNYADYVAQPGAPLVAMATTWLNQERWEQFQQPRQVETNGQPRASPGARGVEYADRYRQAAAELERQQT